MRLDVAADHVDFSTARGALAGRYHHGDRFKPFLHPLLSPKGHGVSLASPHDHKHHKGLLYALRIAGLNFWEEAPTLPGERVGRQTHLAFTDVRTRGDEVGLTETLRWEPLDGGDAVFDETRTLACRREGTGFRWSWTTTLTARRAFTLIQSQWSFAKPDGRRINYHGLGLRLRREFGGGTRNNALQLDDGPLQWNRSDAPFDFTTAMGAVPQRVTFAGCIDGFHPAPEIAVTIEQHQANGLFVLETPFSFVALGPSNLAARPLGAGESLVEHYTVTVADR